MRPINAAQDLIDLRPTDHLWLKTAYADPQFAYNYFAQVYHPNAKLWVQKQFADILYKAAEISWNRFGWKWVILDALRPTEAQGHMYAICERDFCHAAARMNKIPSDLVAPSGRGAHPRGWAVDLAPITERGELIDFGGHFDQFWRPFSLRAREFQSPFSTDAEILKRRDDLENLMQEVGRAYNQPLSCKISDEWWDFRPVPDYYNGFAPLSNNDLPDYMRMLPSDNIAPRNYKDPVLLEAVSKSADGKITYAPITERFAQNRPPAEILLPFTPKAAV
jgi:D-alanyl-D-alanine dipeptidase